MAANEENAAPQRPQQGQQQVHPAAVACEFMQRADMKGGEVEAYAQTFNWLQAIATGELVVIPADELEDAEETPTTTKKKVRRRRKK